MFCGKCGAPLDGGRFCPNCGAAITNSVSDDYVDGKTSQSAKGGKKKLVPLIAIILVVVIVSCFVANMGSSNEPCMYCGDTPTKKYEKSDGTDVYVCKDCRSECMLCGDKATKHYESLLGIVFVCDDCYKEVTGE